MKKKKLSLKIFLISSIFLLMGCTTYTIHDNRIRVHFINQNEKAPYSGVLLNNYTYQKLKECCIKCKH